MGIRERLGQYALLMRLHRPIGILLLLWPTLWALWLAGAGHPSPLVVAVFVAGVVLMRSAGCVINDYADRDFDPHVQRTRDRPVATGKVSPREALALAAVLALVAFGLVLLLNPLTILLSLAGALLAAVYPFTKRITHLPQVVLGIAFGWAVPMAYAAQTGTIPDQAWVVFLATLAWTVAYDTEYAMVDRPDDLRIGVKSSAILFGRADRLVIGLLHALVLVLLWVAGGSGGLGGWFLAGLGVAAALAVYQQILIRRRAPDQCFRAFLNNHWFGMAVWVGIVLDYALSPLPGL